MTKPTPNAWTDSASGYLATYMKKRGNLPVARPTSRGSGIALSVRTSNTEAHSDMHIKTSNGKSQ